MSLKIQFPVTANRKSYATNAYDKQHFPLQPNGEFTPRPIGKWRAGAGKEGEREDQTGNKWNRNVTSQRNLSA